ncbi:MAG: hypothetical protein JST59_02355 [Actinobacteria bacterium]|nr:hypothetical protein [Actinomycetota bacterium]
MENTNTNTTQSSWKHETTDMIEEIKQDSNSNVQRRFFFEPFPTHYVDLILFEDVTNSAEIVKKLMQFQLEGAFLNADMVLYKKINSKHLDYGYISSISCCQ